MNFLHYRITDTDITQFTKNSISIFFSLKCCSYCYVGYCILFFCAVRVRVCARWGGRGGGRVDGHHQLINHSTNQSINQPTIQLTNQPINQPVNQPFNLTAD